MRVFPVDDVQDVTPLEGDAQLVARDVEIVIRMVREVSSVVVLKNDQVKHYFEGWDH